MFDYYILEKGETLSDICKQLNLDKNYIMEINSISDENSLREGSELRVPALDSSYFNTYTIEKGDNLYAIARKYNINPELLASMNGLSMNDYIYPNQELLIPKSGYSYYITKSGDTLNTAATMFKTSIPEMLKDNNVVYLSEGQILVHRN